MLTFTLSSIPRPRLLHWVPTLYATMGFPNIFVASAAAIMYRNLGMSTAEVVTSTSQLYLPWVLKPLWAPLLEAFGTKKGWVVSMQFLLMVLFAATALLLRTPYALSLTLATFWMIGFASATQDIAIDGIFMGSTTPAEQARYAGLQNLCWNIGAVAASGIVVSLSGVLKTGHDLSWAQCWVAVLAICAVLMGMSAFWHLRNLPDVPNAAGARNGLPAGFGSFLASWRTFVAKPKIWTMLVVVFAYRLAEGFVEKIGPIFLLDGRDAGGLGLDNQTLGAINGTLGTIAFIAGTILAGFVVSRMTLRRSFVVLALALNVPHLAYYWLSADLPSNLPIISGAVLVEKFGYGFGSVGHMLYMVQQVSPGRFQMSHYAFATSVMALCKWATGWASGFLFVACDHSYRLFFLFVQVVSVLPVVIAYLAPFPRNDNAAAAVPKEAAHCENISVPH